MGTWGTGLYQDDTACDVKESIKDRLIYGDEEGKRYTKEELIESILEEYEDYMQLDDDRAIVILVLADILWKNGMLTDNLKMEALKIIENKTDLERWEENKKLYICLGSAVHGNLGDQALGLCRVEFLKYCGISNSDIIEYTTRDKMRYWLQICRETKESDIIVLRRARNRADKRIDRIEEILT